MYRVLIVDDEASIRKSLRDILEFEKYKIDDASDGMDCLVKMKANKYDVVILDIKMPNMDGMEALDRIQILQPQVPIVMISGHASIDNAVDAVKKGAFDFISKPPDLNRLLITVRNALDKSTLITETKKLKQKVSKNKIQEMVGCSPRITHIKETIERVAPTDARVLITGPNGTGKELVARWLHDQSNRSGQPLIEVNCAAIPSELIESELFGHEKGSFTSAVKQRIGKFEQANGGILFLDEIGDMSLSAQAKVLRALQEHKITRVGGDREIQVDVRIVAATNKNLMQEIRDGNFREDLYHRLAVILVDVPALKDRIDDLPALAEHFITRICSENGVAPKVLEKKAIRKLMDMPWNGNIRELRNVIERLIILSGKSITAKDIDLYVPVQASNKSELSDLFSKFENIKDLTRFMEKEYKTYKS